MFFEDKKIIYNIEKYKCQVFSLNYLLILAIFSETLFKGPHWLPISPSVIRPRRTLKADNEMSTLATDKSSTLNKVLKVSISWDCLLKSVCGSSCLCGTAAVVWQEISGSPSWRCFSQGTTFIPCTACSEIRARICKPFKEPRSRPSLAESIPGLHNRLQTRAQYSEPEFLNF